MQEQGKKLLIFFFILLAGCVFVANSTFAAEKLDKGVENVLAKRFTCDFPVMKKKRVIRALVPYSKTFYFLDGAQERGATYEGLKEFEKFVNKELQRTKLKIHLVIVPTDREQLLKGLVEGAGDIAAGNLTITENRRKLVDFASPVATGVNEIVVTGPGSSGPVKSIEDLSGKTVHVRTSSSYFENLNRLNRKFVSEKKAPVKLVPVSKYLEDEDLLEMVNAGLIPMIVVDNHKARLWANVFKDIVLHENVQVNSGGDIGWAIRKNSPELKSLINKFVKGHKKGTLFGNVIFNRYFEKTTFVKNSLSEKERKKFTQTIDLFKKYGKQYRFDWLMLVALAYQESAIDQSKRSKAGAIGVMQVLPSTAKDKNIGIANIEKIEPNIHAGTKYIRYMVDNYFSDPELDELNRGLFAFAAYNAGPSKISQFRRDAPKYGVNPNLWFRNVENIAAKKIGRETVQYVSNIFKYYTCYKLIVEQQKLKQVVKEAMKD